MSVALCYNSEIRNNGTAVRCWHALDRPKRYSRPGVNVEEHELYLMIDDGRDDIEWLPPKPNAIWCVDTHLGYDRRLEWSKSFDHVFTAQKEGAAKFRRDGVKAEWVPLACHPPCDPNFSEVMLHPAKDDLTQGDDLTKKHDVCFVGFMNEGIPDDPLSHNRIEFLDTMFKTFPNFWMNVNLFFEEAAVRYIRSRIGLNISIRNDLNMRFFEALSYGTALLSNADQDGWGDLGFVDGEHFMAFEDTSHAISKAKYYLKNSDEREEIAKAGHRLVREKHTYRHRMEQILEMCGCPLQASA